MSAKEVTSLWISVHSFNINIYFDLPYAFVFICTLKT